MFDIKPFGKNLIVKSKGNSEVFVNDKQMFIDLVNAFDNINKRSNEIQSEFSVNLENYDEAFYILIENLFLVNYGDWQTELIVWYVYDRLDDKDNVIPMLVFDELTGEETKMNIKNASELYNFIQSLKKKIKKNKKK